MHKDNNNNFKVEERRRKVAFTLTQSMTQTEIEEKINVDQSTVSRDVKDIRVGPRGFEPLADRL
jgi:hypothetical protein